MSTAAVVRARLLLEREGELAAIDRAVAEVAAGEGRLLLIEGPAGIGKSRLVAEARAHALAAGLRARSARGSELERGFPFGVVRQLLEQDVSGAESAALLAGAAAGARPVFAAPGDGGGEAGDASFAVLHGLYWLCVNLAAEGPLCLAVDDLHWCDPPSLRFLAYLARRLEGLPVLVAASLRPADPGADAGLLAELVHDPTALMLRPGPLTPAAATALISERLGAPAHAGFAQACHTATGGNPLLLNELLAAMRAEGMAPEAVHAEAVREIAPRAVARAVLARLARLDPASVAVARAVALLGEGADVARVGELAEADPAAVARATDELARAEILRPDPPLGFVHPLVRAAVYHDLSPGERDRQHARAARLLAAAGAPPEQVAAHLSETTGRGEAWVVDALMRAAAVAMSRGAGDVAVTSLRRALAEPAPADRRPELLFRLGIAEGLQSGTAAVEHLRGAYDATADPLERAGIAWPLASILLFTDGVPEAVALAREASDALPPGQDDLRHRLDALRLAACHWRLDPATFHAPELAGHGVGLLADTVGARMVAGIAAYTGLLAGRPAAEVAGLARLATSDGVLVEIDNEGVPYSGSLITLACADDDEALNVSDMSRARAHRSGSQFEAAGAALFRGLMLLRRGDVGEAARLAEGAVGRVVDWGSGSVRIIAAAHEADARLATGDAAGAAAVLDAALPPAAPRPDGTHLAWWLATRLRVLLALSEHEAVLEAAAEGGERFAGTVENPAVLPWRSMTALALDRLGRTGEAIPLAEAELDLARGFGAPGTVGAALRVVGTILRGDGRAHLEEAVAVTGASPARLEHARALTALGTHLRLERRPTEARDPLRRALEIATACEAAPLVEHVRHEIQATGARPRTDALSGVAALTASERRVADMALDGATNKDIAQSLYVTPKTVEVHLSSAYRKLGIRSRRELAGVLARAS